jgi:GTPase SAR1 family protein
MQFSNFGQIILGPAGSGKSTYCKIMQEHAESLKREIVVINLDPAAESFKYTCDIDIRELVTVVDVMLKKKLGPNGALIYCMEYLLSHMEWLEEQIESFAENSYFLFDCPGQLELYSHYDIITNIIKTLQRRGFSLCSVFCLDCTFLQEQSKFISGNLLSLATMIQVTLPHLTVLTKCDLISKTNIYKEIENGMTPEDLVEELTPFLGKKIDKLNELMINFVKNFSLVSLRVLNPNNEDTISAVMYEADMVLQYFDSLEPREADYINAEKNLMGNNEE